MVENISKTLFFNILFVLFIAISCFMVGKYVAGRKKGVESKIIHKTDTITIRDTIVSYRAKKEVIPKGYQVVETNILKSYEELVNMYRDSLNRKPRTINIHDTSYITIPISDYIFTDNKTYKVAINGYDCKLLWHESYKETQILTPHPEYLRHSVTFSPVFGFVGAYSGFMFKVGIKLDLAAKKDRWHFVPEIGYSMTYKNDWTKGFYGGANIRYDLIRR